MAKVTAAQLELLITFGRNQLVKITAIRPVAASSNQSASTPAEHEALVREVLVKTIRAYDHQDNDIELLVNNGVIQRDPGFPLPPLNFADAPAPGPAVAVASVARPAAVATKSRPEPKTDVKPKPKAKAKDKAKPKTEANARAKHSAKSKPVGSRAKTAPERAGSRGASAKKPGKKAD